MGGSPLPPSKLCTLGEAGGGAILPRVDQPNVPASTITHTANQIDLTLPSFAGETIARGLKEEFTLRVKPRRHSGYRMPRQSIQELATNGTIRCYSLGGALEDNLLNPWDLVDNLCDLALSEPSDLSERVLRAALSFTMGSRGAIFERRQERLRLAASRGVDQGVLDDVQKHWLERRKELVGGVPVLGGGVALYPIMAHVEMIGLLYVDTPRRGFGEPRDLQAIGQFARVAAHSLKGRRSDLQGYLAATAPDTVARDQLLVVLDQNEWNIARVARLLRVTRPTIYGRMRRFGIQRQRHLLGKR